MNKISLALLLVLCVTCSFAFRKQGFRAKGRLLCAGKPESNVRVKIVDEDSGPDPDDELDAGYTDGRGTFSLQGTTRELTNIDPFLKIYHDCNDHGKPCQRKWKIKVPYSYVEEYKKNKVFDIGEINLEVKIDGEERDCSH